MTFTREPKSFVEVDLSSIRFVTYVTDEVSSFKIIDEKFYLDITNLNEEISNARRFIVLHKEKLGFAPSKIDVVYKDNFLNARTKAIKSTIHIKKNSEQADSDENLDSTGEFLKSIDSDFSKKNQEDFAINITPLEYSISKHSNYWQKFDNWNDVSELKRVKIKSLITYVENDKYFELCEALEKLGLVINKIYSFAEISNSLLKDNGSDYINVHLSSNATFITQRKNDKIVKIEQFRFGENYFIKWLHDKFNLNALEAEKTLYTYASKFDLIVENPELRNNLNSLSPLLSYPDYFKEIENYIILYWEKLHEFLSEKFSDYGSKQVVVFSGAFNFMGKAFRASDAFITNSKIVFIENQNTEFEFNENELSHQYLNRIYQKANVTYNFESTYTFPEFFYEVKSPNKLKKYH
ncbi:hypothetical protein ACA758_03405 [Mycoplasmopsis agassizii]|uniref:hypothetical protein n=1 Tax=Mycoplasmopsis agassizii TaxID=33922 RepID=UPI003526E27B